MSHATDPVLPTAATPIGVYVVSTTRTLDGGGSDWVEARLGNRSVAVATIATVTMPLPTIMRFIVSIPSVGKAVDSAENHVRAR